MGRTVFTVLCWLVVTTACLGTGSVSGIKDNAGAESAPRLYRNAPLGIYASAAPHGAFTFQVPTAISLKPSQLVPVNQESLVIEKSNGFLKDSYGNKFVAPSQSVAYQTTYPQQFVQLQHLPDHLAQPLSAAPSYHFPQGPPQAFFSSQYRLPSADAVTSPLTRYGVTHPFAYASAIKSLTPASDQQFQFVSPVAQLNSNNNNQVIYGTKNPVHNEPKFQRLEEKPAAHHTEYHERPQQQQVAQSIKSQVQAPVRHTVKTTHNGKDTVVQIETKPPLPLLDLSLLEPLTFANPIVPQVQHYLPKINAVTYKELHPSDVEEVKKHNNEFLVQKTKSYDSGVVKGKPHSDVPKKKQKTPPKKDTTVHVHYEKKSEKPSIKVKGKPNDAEYSYEIKSPNYKETYNEQVVSYNKQTKSDPVTYTYQKETQKEPVTYSFSHSSKDPGQTQKVQYVKKDPVPNHLVYQFQPAEQSAKHNDGHHSSPDTESEDSGESSDSDDETPSYDHAQYDNHHDKPSHSHQSTPSHSHHSHPTTSSQHSHNPTHSHSSQSHHPSTHSNNPTHSHSPQSNHPSTYSHHPTHSHSSTQSHHSSTQSHDPSHSHSASQSHHPTTHSHSAGHAHPSPHPSTSQSHHPTPHSHSADHAHPSPQPHYSTGHPATHSHQSQPQHSNAEQQSHNPHQAYYTVTQKSPQYYSHPQLTPLHEFMENLRFIPSFTNAAIRVDPNQHVQKQPGQYYTQQTTPRARSNAQLSSEPVIYEKSKKIIIQEESPDEVHSHQEKLTAQMVGKEENNEEDFEKSYKEAAYGFPAYDRDSTESDDEIYNPENYGEPQNSEEDSGKHYEEYQEEGDEFPKFARLGYKDSRDKTKESYFQDYSIQKPESMTDRYQSKINYYKMFLKHKPEKLRHSDNSEKNKELAKYTVAPSFYDSAPKQKSKQSAAYKAAPAFEYEYLKDSRDSSPHASRPTLRYKSRTHFVEPQFQYGFEPIAIPRLDSELDTMASNVSPESEKPGTRKKVYKENWYIKKTSTSSKPS